MRRSKLDQTATRRKHIVLIEPNEVELALSGSLFREPLERALVRARQLDETTIKSLIEQWAKRQRFYQPHLGRIAQIQDTKHS
ncbi:MAG: hypothetical protein KatS3mg056_1739 [Chloroflexus sp.]|nr:MAG: hypothetical protein KatS3mg056_1739 [Chloroflexus sp.]